MLAGVDNRFFDTGFAKRATDRRSLNKLRPGANDGDDVFHFAFSSENSGKSQSMRRDTRREAKTTVHSCCHVHAYCRLVKILIVTAFYPPENTIAAQRPLSWARAWAVSGHEVTVLTVQRDGANLGEAGNGVVGVRVLGVSPSGGFAWLRQTYRRMARKSLPQGAASIAPATSNRKKLLGWFKSRGLLSSVRWPDVYDFWTAPALKAVGGETFDVVISTFGPPAVFAIGESLRRRGQTKKWVLDFRDLWTENPSFRGFPIVRWFERRAENRYLKLADAVTTVSEPLAETLRRRRKEVSVFTNGFERENVDPSLTSSAVLPSPPEKVIRYTGSLYWPHQDPTPLFRALRARSEAGRGRIRVEFYGPGLERIRNLAATEKVSSCVTVFDSCTREESLRLQQTADALLFLESPSTPGREGILTGKLFEYLAARKPILAVGVGSQSLAGRLIAECDAGFCVEHDDSKIERFLSSVEQAKFSIEPRGLPERFSRRKIADEMLRFITSL